MPFHTKITLSDKELSLIQNTDWFFVKKAVIDKVYLLFSVYSKFVQNEMLSSSRFPEKALDSTPKISRGEQYLGLPYVILDYPKFFDKSSSFAIRTMFWWGNFFSITLLVSGEYKKRIDQKALELLAQQHSSLFLCISSSEWAHHFEPDNYIPLHQLKGHEISERLSSSTFIKLALKFPLTDWEKLEEFLREGYQILAGLLISYPNDEKGLSPDIPKADFDL